MAARVIPPDAPEPWLQALAALRRARLRPEVVLEEVPAPQRIAPFTVAMSADVVVGGEEVATGRFVLLHDPEGQDAWQGTFRAVTFVRATMEPELGADPLVGQIGWTWLVEALAQTGARATAEGGTVTRVVSDSFGSLAGRPSTVEIEVRASWTPVDADLEPHVQAWAQVLCSVAGLPPLPDGVASLPRRRS